MGLWTSYLYDVLPRLHDFFGVLVVVFVFVAVICVLTYLKSAYSSDKEDAIKAFARCINFILFFYFLFILCPSQNRINEMLMRADQSIEETYNFVPNVELQDIES